MVAVNLAEKLALVTEFWSPKVVGAVNGCHVKLVKLKGEFVWHAHESEDELFLVLDWHAAHAVPGPARSPSGRGSSSSFRMAPSIVRWPTRKSTCCCSSRRRR